MTTGQEQKVLDALDEWDEYYEVYDFEYDAGCNTCGGSGWIVTCVDDMCRGAGECMHGDGEEPCPDCDAWM